MASEHNIFGPIKKTYISGWLPCGQTYKTMNQQKARALVQGVNWHDFNQRQRRRLKELTASKLTFVNLDVVKRRSVSD